MDQPRRSLVKTISWRITGSSATFLIAYLLTGNFAVAGVIGVTQMISNTILYYVHERIWNKIRWGIGNQTGDFECQQINICMSTQIITEKQLAQLIPGNKYVAQWCHALNTILPDYGIDTNKRVAAFIAQCAHESGNFRFLRENLNYKAESLTKTFKKYFPTLVAAQPYAKKPEKIANKVYANRMGNGDEASGDGFRYLGRGLIQLTGKENYSWFAASLEIPVEDVAEYLGTFEGAVQSACWFWETNNLNKWADSGDIVTLSKRINGGTIGLEDRIKHYNHALHVLGGH